MFSARLAPVYRKPSTQANNNEAQRPVVISDAVIARFSTVSVVQASDTCVGRIAKLIENLMGLTTSKSATGDGGKTTSSSAIDSKRAMETGSVTIQVAGYSRTKGIGVGKSINSCKFHDGGVTPGHLDTWYIYTSPTTRRRSPGVRRLGICLPLPRPADAADVVTAEYVFSIPDGSGHMVRMKIPPSSPAASSSSVVVPPPDLHRHLRDLLASGRARRTIVDFYGGALRWP
uniref:Transposon protein-like n=1 Tax=Oryza nivara TaxID=4536 RepID=A0A679BAE0_ORYNI|nr:transposon protein-like [Oryza sativa f. spontanea]